MNKGYIKHGEIIVSMTGDICCPNDKCPYVNGVGLCTDTNAKCVHEKDRNAALLHYMFGNDKEATIELRNCTP